jgi:hypothetical protein
VALALLLPHSPLAFESIESDQLTTPAAGGSGGISAAIDGRSGNTERESYTVGGRSALSGTRHGDAHRDRTQPQARPPIQKSKTIPGYMPATATSSSADWRQRPFVDHLADDFRLLDSRTQLGAGVALHAGLQRK